MRRLILLKKRADSFQEFSGDFMWEINLSDQLLSFFYAVITGFVFCFIYDILKSCRLTFSFSAVSIFFSDIFYSAVIAIIAFLVFLGLSNGEIRSYILSGFLLGFVFWRLTVSKLLLYIFKKVFRFSSCVFGYINQKILDFLEVLAHFSVKFLSFFKNSKILLKKLLKRHNGLLYTKQE